MRIKLDEHDVMNIANVFGFATQKEIGELKLRRLDYMYFLSTTFGRDKSGFFSQIREKKGLYNPYLTYQLLTCYGVVTVSILDEPNK
jgi:hypothetical protein